MPNPRPENSEHNRIQMREMYSRCKQEMPDARMKDLINVAHDRIHERAPVSGAFVFLKGKQTAYSRATFVRALRGYSLSGAGGKVDESLLPAAAHPAPTWMQRNGDNEDDDTGLDESLGAMLDLMGGLATREQAEALMGFMQDTSAAVLEELAKRDPRVMADLKAVLVEQHTTQSMIRKLAKAMFDGGTDTMRTALSKTDLVK